MKKNNTIFWVRAGLISAVYIVLTLISSIAGLAFGPIQIRFSEVICILPAFTPSAIWGLFVGCFLSNIIFGAPVWDVVFGSLATLIGAAGTFLLRKNRYLACLPPIFSNLIIVPLILKFAYQLNQGYWFLVLGVGVGEVITAGVIGQVLFSALNKQKDKIFK